MKRHKKQDVPLGCRACSGTGMISETISTLDPQLQLPVTVDTTRWCTCLKGIWREKMYRIRMERNAPR